MNDPNRAGLNISHYFLFILIFVAFFLCYQMMRPYLDSVILAVILAVLSHPAFEWIKKKCKNRKNTAAFISTLLLTLIIVIPFLLIISAIIRQGIVSLEAVNQWISQGNLEKLEQLPMVTQALGLFHKYVAGGPFQNIDINSLLIKLSSVAGEFLVNQGKSIIGNISAMTGKLFLMIFIFFFLVQDQKKIIDYLFHISPLSTAHETILIHKVKNVAKSALLGTLVTASAQGAAGGLAFAICGLPGFFWGAVMAFTSLIPMVGTALIWIPGAGYLFLSGFVKSGIFLIIWCVTVVGLMDNLVRPMFMKGAADMSTLLIFFSVLGGIHYFGLTGILYGPLVFGLTLVLLYIYELEFQSFLDAQDRT